MTGSILDSLQKGNFKIKDIGELFAIEFISGDIIKLYKSNIQKISHLRWMLREMKGYFKEYSPNEGDDVVDGGAFVGLFSIIASKIIGNSGKILAFEPDARNFEQFKKNLQLNDIKNVIALNKGLYSEDTSLRFNALNRSHSSLYFKKGVSTKIVQFVSLDNELSRRKIKTTNFIKLDVEGAETDVIRGAEKLLQNNDVHLAVASYHIVDEEPRFIELEKMMKERGYKTYTDFSWHYTTYSSKSLIPQKTKRILVENVSKKFKIGFRRRQGTLARIISLFSGRESKKEITALKDLSISFNAGELIGIIGANGCGKSTLLRVIAGIYRPDSGKIKINGKIISLINLGAGMQERLSMRDNIFLCCSLFDLGRDLIKKRFDSIVHFAELEEYVDTKLYQFSEGMKQRLAFAIAMHCNPEILILDEVFEVGDEEFRKKSQSKIEDIIARGATVILVSHDLSIIRKHCDTAILMDKGNILASGNPEKILRDYTALLAEND